MSFNVKFSANGNILGSLPGKEDMLVPELLFKFNQICGLEEKDKVTYTFQSTELKITTYKTLKEKQIIDGSIIEVKSEKTLKPFENPGNEGNSQSPQNNFPGGNSQNPQNNFPGNGGNFQVPQNNFPGNGFQVPQNNFPFMMNNNNFGMMFNQNMNNYGMMNNYGIMYNQNAAMNQNMNNFGMMYNPYMAMNQNVII